MGTSFSIAELVGKIEKASAGFERARLEAPQRRMAQMDQIHAQIINAAIGGDSFSHWAIPAIARATPFGDGDVRFNPVGKSYAPERVAQSGRHAGMARGVLAGGAFGPVFGRGGISKKTGKALKGRKHKRWNGTTKGYDTWDLTVTQFRRVIPTELRADYTTVMADVFQ